MTSKRDGDLPGAVWFRNAPQRRRAPALNRDRIVTAAVDLLDRDGIDGLSLRKLAGGLEVHATSLYWHVNTKDDVVDLALDEVFAEINLPVGEQAEGRREFIATYMQQLRAMLLRHPWAAALAGTRPLAGPNALARSEAVYAALDMAGFTGAELSAAASAVTNLVVASASTQAAWANQAEAESRDALQERIAAHDQDYPTLSKHLAGFLGDWDTQFELTTQYLLDGLGLQQQ
ncbi:MULTISPECIES: TetR/AcrR family transcriptional regulator [Brevibacterium]|uniref:TetR/AcrR family transcriptional regulator C-terminal domain-containing protein n=1 Tax=Brevibacterium picturae TaxID=260553 RepID=A0ABN2BIJ0_9MICO|nr:TetR/AcrR family transcriptional regulator C-terminal domain-containing protein [Brevibacterium atlanticum]